MRLYSEHNFVKCYIVGEVGVYGCSPLTVSAPL